MICYSLLHHPSPWWISSHLIPSGSMLGQRQRWTNKLLVGVEIRTKPLIPKFIDYEPRWRQPPIPPCKAKSQVSSYCFIALLAEEQLTLTNFHLFGKIGLMMGRGDTGIYKTLHFEYFFIFHHRNWTSINWVYFHPPRNVQIAVSRYHWKKKLTYFVLAILRSSSHLIWEDLSFIASICG